MLDVMQGSDGTMKERSGNNTCICIGFGIKNYAFSLLEASRRNLEASSRRLKHTLGRLKAASRCWRKNLSVSGQD